MLMESKFVIMAASSCCFVIVTSDWIVGGLVGFNPPVHFSTPQLVLKNYLGVRLNPPEQHSIAQCILLSVCIKRFPTRVSFRMIRSSEDMTVLWIIYLFISVDVAHADVLFLYIYTIYTAMYTRMYSGSREIKSLNAGHAAECYRVAQNKWDLLLKLCMGYFFTIKVNYTGIVVSVCVFSMVKPVQCLLNMDRKWTLSISAIVST